MHDITPTIIPTPPESPTIVPPQCASCLEITASWLENHKRPVPEPFRCNRCLPLGQRIANALYEDFLWWARLLAWNLTIGALLETAAVQAIRDVEAVRDMLRSHTRNPRRAVLLDECHCPYFERCVCK